MKFHTCAVSRAVYDFVPYLRTGSRMVLIVELFGSSFSTSSSTTLVHRIWVVLPPGSKCTTCPRAVECTASGFS
eukprot:3733630-Rhodomonas_salina.4